MMLIELMEELNREFCEWDRDYSSVLEDYIDTVPTGKELKTRATRRRNMAKKKAKAVETLRYHGDFEGYDLRKDKVIEEQLHILHGDRLAKGKYPWLKDFDKPRRRYSIYEDYEDRPQCFITIEPEVVYVIKEHWI